MKITAVGTLCLSRQHEPERQWFTASYLTTKADCTIVSIYTDEGITGIGEACSYGSPPSIKDWVEWLSTQLIGKDPLDKGIVPHTNGRSWAYDTAVAGIDCALWDLKGKIAEKKVCELLTDKPLDKVRLYASGGCRYNWRKKPEQLIEEALDYIKAGYTAMKFRIGTDWSWDGITVDRFIGLVRELVQVVNGRMELMLDANCRLTEDQALQIAKELARLNFVWFEEPIPANQINGYARLCASVDMPISGGETLTTTEQFRPYLDNKAYGIVQQDAGICGITEGINIAKMAYEQYGVKTCPHNWHNGLMTMANAHFVASLPSPKVLELCMIQGPLQWDIITDKPIIENGWLILPDKPGLGVELRDDLIERFPYIDGNYGKQIRPEDLN
ncbi:TPA: mandelate racemase/muconate lactonizing enzyme family protein [bacterium]|nr:mandelate racemase/muconate lactonizing enzyme family protein [bacterium]